MCQNPNIQAKGRDEIERVIGTDRLPTFEDRQSLPYVEAIYREVMRLHPALPLGLPHVSIEDDFYRGYHIPKGSKHRSLKPIRLTSVQDVWLYPTYGMAMNRDPDVYTEPDRFLPERYSESPTGPFESINNIYAFGFGRRVCAGRHMAENTIWLTIASVLATFTLGKAKDGKGNEIDIPGEYTDQFFRYISLHRYYPAQYNKIHEFLRQLLMTPDKFMQHTMKLSQALVYKGLYGLDVDSEDPLAKKAVEVMDTLGQALLPGSFPAYERFPFLRFMPSWFPGCRFKRIAIQCSQGVKEVDTIPFDIAMAHLESGTGTSPIAELAIRKPQDIKAIKAMGTISYLASADTVCILDYVRG
ncbi:cytochrome P450 1 [Lentinula edodes]|uniref:Cytochrome P450 1 n=1 Tax=Lentinula edodes TaxID=5353 RepID=A0A1Q3DXZ0_LENED|nr:cytochrome P450 1 [Lentinula edodes]